MRPAAHQHGATTLAITVVLSMVMLLVVGFANRNVVLELRSATHQYRATLAFEAAEAGLDWALAQLNNPAALNAQCLPSNAADARTLRDRLLSPQADGSWAPHGRAAQCTKLGADWACLCPSDTAASAEASTADADAAAAAETAQTPIAFSVRITAGERPGLLHVSSQGCAGGSPCLPSTAPSADAQAQAEVHVSLGALPLLASEPSAALSVRGDLTLEGPWQIARLDPSGSGLALHLGGTLQGQNLGDTLPAPHSDDTPRITAPPGSPRSSAVLSPDPALASLSAHALFLSLFRLAPRTWQAQPYIHRVPCASACDAALAAALQAPGPHPALWLPDGLRLTTPAPIGSPSRPVLLVVDGPVQLSAATHLHGLLYARHSEWADTAGATVHGAVVAEGALHGSGNTHISHHPGVLQQLQAQPGTLARVAGSWRDF